MPSASSSAPLTARFDLWGGTADVAVTEPAALDGALAAVRAVVDRFDRACSSHRADSELAAVNLAAGAGPFALDDTLLGALAAALRAAELTDGDVDPTVGFALLAHRLAPDAEFGIRPAAAVRFEPVPGYRTVRLDRDAGTVTLPAGVRLDLGATAKALAADQAAAAAVAAGGGGVLVNLLGDLSTAGEPLAGGWAVRVTDDHRSRPDAPGQTVAVHHGGLATSSTTVRRTPDGRGHHLIDPRTGRPAVATHRTVSVAGATCLDANIAATAAIVRGAAGAAWLAASGLPARLVALDGTVTHVGGWPREGEQQR